MVWTILGLLRSDSRATVVARLATHFSHKSQVIILRVHGYAGINPLFKDAQSPRRVGCNDHARRKFVNALEQGDTRAQKVLDLYRALYAVERHAREKKLGVAALLALRKKESIPIWQELEACVNRQPIARA